MRAFRITLRGFGRSRALAFSGLSGFSTDGRWHSAGRYLDYAAESVSLATLERLVHYKSFEALQPHVLFELEVPDAMIETVQTPPRGWNGVDLLPAAQAIGNSWRDRNVSPALLVPSAVTLGERNLLLNSRHPQWDWSWVHSGPRRFTFDRRLV